MSLEIVDALIKSLEDADSSDLSQEGKNTGNAEEETLSFVRTSLGYLGYRSYSNDGIVGAYNRFSEDKTKKINDKAFEEITKQAVEIKIKNFPKEKKNKENEVLNQEINRRNDSIYFGNEEIEARNFADEISYESNNLTRAGFCPAPLEGYEPLIHMLHLEPVPVFHEMEAPILRSLSDLDSSKLQPLLSELGTPYLQRNAEELASAVLECFPDDSKPLSYARHIKVIQPVSDISRGLDHMDGRLDVGESTINFVNRSLEALGYQSGVDGLNELYSDIDSAEHKRCMKMVLPLPDGKDWGREIIKKKEKDKLSDMLKYSKNVNGLYIMPYAFAGAILNRNNKREQKTQGVLASVFAWCNRKLKGSDAGCDGSSTPYHAMNMDLGEPRVLDSLNDLEPEDIKMLIYKMLDEKTPNFMDDEYLFAAMLGDAVLESRGLEGAPVTAAEKLSGLGVGEFERDLANDPLDKDTFEASGVPFL